MSIPFIKDPDGAALLCKDKCDKYDYLIAAGCGAVAGLVDVFLVGAPGQSALSNWTDAQVDKCVMTFAKLNKWDDNGNVKSAIGFLERKFRVNYDQRHSADVDGMFHMSAKNHHMKSLGHSPDLFGLFFSVLDQFSGTSTFLSDGKVYIKVVDSELVGGNFVAKLFCGVVNWFGHLMSDVAGSSGAVGRGSGIVMPFYELFGLCNFGDFSGGDGARMSLAKLATLAFEEGYDARFGLTMAIPVVLCDLLIRLIWAIRRRFEFQKPWNECLPTRQHGDLRVMLLVGNGTLCVTDLVGALVQSGGEPIAIFMHLNLIAWYKFAKLAVREVCIRLGVPPTIQETLEAFKRINAALQLQLQKLERIDIAAFQRETQAYNEMVRLLDGVKTEKELSERLTVVMERMGIELPWRRTHGSFDSFMRDKSAVLRIE